MLPIKSIQKDLILIKAEKFLRKVEWSHYLTKWAADTSHLLGELNEFVDSVKNENLFNNLTSLLDNYEAFLEEIGPHKLNKNLVQAGHFSSKARGALNSIATDSYIDIDKDGFFQEEEDFDVDKFLSVLQNISNDILHKIEALGDVPEYDEASEIKNAVVNLLNNAKQDPQFVELLNAGGINDAIRYLKNKEPELVNMMSQIENIKDLTANDWQEIQEDLNQSTTDKYDKNFRIIDRNKQREAKEVWISQNPAKHLEQKQRAWQKLKSDPIKYQQHLEKKRKDYKRVYNERQDREKADRLKNWHEKQKREKKLYELDEYGMRVKPENWQANLLTSNLGGYNIQTLRNKFVVAAARDTALRIASELQGKSITSIKGLTKEDRDKLLSEAKQHPKYINFIQELPAKLSSNKEFAKIRTIRPDIAAAILESIGRLRSGN